MRWCFDEEEESFRTQVRGFLRDRPDLVEPRQFFHGRGGGTRRLYRAIGEKGWLSLSWPVEYGGQGLPPTYEYILWDELAYARAARPDLAAGIVAKTLMTHGTEEQRKRLLPGIRRGQTSFALGYSEPEAGSDLRRVRTTAVRDGNGYRVNGEKRWTSDAHNSDLLWTLCRMDSDPRATTILMIELDAPGVTIRPIETIDGHQLNEVFLDDVVVPIADRVGDEGDAWSIVREALAVERHLMLLPGRVRRDFDDLTAWMEQAGLAQDAVLRFRLDQLAVDVAEVDAQGLRTLAEIEAGRDATLSAARVKLLGSETSQRIAQVAFDLGFVTAAIAESDPEFLWRQTVMETIAGGTSEVMRGVIARTGLGLGAGR